MRASEWTSREVAEVVGGELIGPEDLRIAGVSTDTRDALVGCLFVALRGERFDAHDFLKDAIDRGANSVLVDRDLPAQGVAVVKVRDTLHALGELAKAHRKKMKARSVALTGSNGKTTTKEMLAAVLSVGWKALKTEGNLNNLIGLPMTLLGLRPEHQVAVIEMGMNTPGEIARYTELTDPDVGMVINVGPAHIGMLGSIEAIARAKGELYRGLRFDAIAVINADDPHVVRAAEEASAPGRLTFGRAESADVRLLSIEEIEDAQTITVSIEGKTYELVVPFVGEHNAMNATAAIAAAHAVGAPIEWAIEGLPKASKVARRLAVELVGPYLLVDDCYNANAASMTAALTTVGARAQREGRRLIAVLGEMRELGDYADELHAVVGRIAAESGAAIVAAFGPMARPIAETAAQHGAVTLYEAEDVEKLFAWVQGNLRNRDLILVKGSRGIRMERFIERLKAEVGR